MRTIVFYICGIIISGFGALMLIPSVVDCFYQNNQIAVNTLYGAMITIVIGLLMVLAFYAKFNKINKIEMFFITVFTWVIIGVFCALPFYFSVDEFDFVAAYFEATSALTTTGISAVSGVEVMSKGLLLWRSLLQWIGGVGIVMMAIAILPILRVGGMQLFYTESSEKMNKAAPTMKAIIYRICIVYFSFTAIFALLYWWVEMSPFDAINFSFAAISTGGGNVTYNEAVGAFSNTATYWLIAGEMLFGAMPFMFTFYLISGNKKEVIANSQVRYYLSYIIGASILISAYVWFKSDKILLDVITDVFFYVVSFASTTGMVKDDYLLFGYFIVGVLFLMTIVGGCTDSTAGGIKVFRLQVVTKVVKKYLKNMFRPHQVIIIKYNNQKIGEDIIGGVFVFVCVFIMTVTVLSFIMIATGINPSTAFLAIVGCVVNNGIGIGDIIGNYGSFGNFPDVNKLILTLAMVLGRLEFLTALVLLMPSAWKNN